MFDAKGYRIRRWVSSALWRTPFYRLSLWSWPQKRLSLSLDPAGLPDPYHSGGVASVEALPWQAPAVSLERQAELHSFAWVAGLAATEGAAAAAPARTILRAWLDQYRQWDPVAWRADVAGERLCIWIAHAALLAPSEDPSLQKDFLAALSRQSRHLRRTAHWEVDGIGRLKALRGLLAALLALRAGDRRVDAAFRAIEREANAQILRDGGHIGRSPALQLEALRQLIGMRDILDAANVEVPEAIMAAINRAAPILRFFRHGDGRLALFNDSIEGDSAALDVTLSRSGVKARAPASAPLIGFERLQSGKSLLIMDCGAPPPERFGGHPHAGTLSFELSHGRERLIVNCGAYRGASAQWQSAVRTTAAHSTLVLADAPSTEIDDRGHLTAGPRTVTRERTEEEGNQWAAASHDGYLARFGLTHERQLFLAADGEDLRGEDRLLGDAGQDFVIRFHLHPNVQASMTQDGSAALLRLPSGAGWRLRAEGAVLSLADSVYLGTGELRKSQQIVLGGHVGSQGATVRWAIRREGRRRADVLATSAPNAREQPRERS